MQSFQTPSFMELALTEARLALENGEVPVGAAIISPDRSTFFTARNRMRELKDPTAHAEILVIRAACQALQAERLNDYDLYVSLEPCSMCVAAISFARIRRLYYGASDPKTGGIEKGVRFFSQSTCHHIPEIYSGIEEQNSALLLKNFFSELRK
ncbi:MAG: nucleoside deaminase [Hyphomicrobium sp.]